MQCCHEICLVTKLSLSLFGKRLLNDLTYNEIYSNEDKLLNFNNIRNDQSIYKNNIDICNNEDKDGYGESVEIDALHNDTVQIGQLCEQKTFLSISSCTM